MINLFSKLKKNKDDTNKSQSNDTSSKNENNKAVEMNIIKNKSTLYENSGMFFRSGSAQNLIHRTGGALMLDPDSGDFTHCGYHDVEATESSKDYHGDIPPINPMNN